MRPVIFSGILFLPLLLIYMGGCKKSGSAAVTKPPVDFSWNYERITNIPSYAVINMYQFKFTSNAPSGSSYEWDFGDGSLSSDSTPKHTFRSLGTFKVTLSIKGTDTKKITRYIDIATSLPRKISYTGVILPDSPLYFQVNVLPDSTFLWEFGDGTTSTEPAPHHTFAASGTYSVKLTINNNPATSAASNVKILNDPLHTHLIGGLRLWHHTSHFGTTTTTSEETFELACINPLQVMIGTSVLNYSPDASTDSMLRYSYYSTDHNGNNHDKLIYFYYLKDSIRIETYDRLSAAVTKWDVWVTQ